MAHPCHVTTDIKTLDTRLSQMEVTGEYAEQNCICFITVFLLHILDKKATAGKENIRNQHI
jgi:hypothetical protein